jgi:hypothetical protein
MTPRERLLALGVGTTVGLFGALLGFTKIRDSLQAKQELAASAEADFEQAKLIENAGLSAGNKLNKLKPKSLPAKFETLSAQYSAWLTQLGKESGLEGVKVDSPKAPAPTGKTDAYVAYDFTLRGKCRTDQVIELLGRFYDKDYLHTIKNLKIVQSKDPNEVDVVLDARALTLKGASSDQAPSKESSGRLAMSIEDYKQTILNRNPFSLPNQPPKIATTSAEIVRGDRWSLNLEASDPENQRVSFELVSKEIPQGLALRGNSLSWKPDDLGEFTVLVRAKDNGWPSMASEKELKLRVIDPPVVPVKVETPKFDVATQAFITMIAGRVSSPTASIRSRTEGKTIDLKEGADFEIGSIKAKVLSINLVESFIELETEGNRWTVGMGPSLADAYSKSLID